MREGEGSISGTLELKESQKIYIFVSLCDNSARKRAGEQKIYCIVKNYMSKCGNTIKNVNFFQNREGTGQCLGFTLRNFVKTILKRAISFKAPANLP